MKTSGLQEKIAQLEAENDRLRSNHQNLTIGNLSLTNQILKFKLNKN